MSVDWSSVGRLRWSVRPVGHFLGEIDNRWEVVGIAVEPHTSAMRTQRVAFVLSLLLDEEIAVEDGKVTLVVSAEPDGWFTEATAPQLRVRAAAELPLPEGDAALLPREDVEISANGDGTAVVTVPRKSAAAGFFKVEDGSR